MADSLSQKEIDNLLDQMASGTLNIDQVLSGAKKKSEVTNYDFRRPNRISKNQIRFLQNIHDHFSETFSYYLVSKLQTIVSIELNSIDQLFYSEYILSVSSPGCLYIFDVEGADGSGILEISPALALNVVERLLGGDAETQPKSRSITPIEQSVLRNVIEHAYSDLGKAWELVEDIKFKYNRMEAEADFVQIAPTSEIVLVLSFDLHIGENSYPMSLCYPTFTLEEKLNKLNRQVLATGAYSQNIKKQKPKADLIKNQMEKSTLPITVELGKTSISVKELLELDAGDLLMTKKRVNEEVEVSIGGHKKLKAKIGNVEGKKAVKITDRIKDNEIIDPDI